MDRSLEVLTLLVLIVVTSGCIDGPDETQSEGGSAIGVEQLRVQPSNIYSGSSSNAILHIRNDGELEADLNVNSEAGEYGDRILKDRCRDFLNVESYSVQGLEGDSSVSLAPRQEVIFNWVLKNPESSNVPLNGYSCNLKFQVPFDYSVNAYKQIQFKESREVEGSPNLESKSSRGPMKLEIDTIGSTSGDSSTFIEGDNAEIIVTLVNQAEEGSSYTGFIDADVPEIEADSDSFSLEEGCTDQISEGDLTMYKGESQSIRCDVELNEEVTGSVRGEITAQTDYTYVKDIGTRTIEVEYRGN